MLSAATQCGKSTRDSRVGSFYQLGNLSVIAPLANVVLLPVVPYAMLFGAVAMVAGMIYLPLGQALALLAYLFLAWLTEGAHWFARVPGAAVQLPPFPLWVLLAYYAIVLGGWLWSIDPSSADQCEDAAKAGKTRLHLLDQID